MTHVKICGLTRLEDAMCAARLGARALGFNFWPGSKRFIEPARARAIIEALPPFVTAVGVFVNQSREEIEAACSASRAHVAQLHGDEPPALCLSLSRPVIKAFRAGGPLDDVADYRVAAVLLDAPGPGFGGGGVTFDWDLVPALAQPLVLAGGLTADNVADAIRRVRPYAVDVASGVESSPGVKDEALLRRFFAAVATSGGDA